MDLWKKYFDMQNYAKAYELLSGGNTPVNAERLDALVCCCYQLSLFEEAEKYAIQSMEAAPSLDHLHNLISAKFKLDKYGEVVHFGLQYIERNPENFIMWDMLGDSFLKLGNYEEAKKSYLQMKGDYKKIADDKLSKIPTIAPQDSENIRLENWADKFYSYSKYGAAGRQRTTLSQVSLFKDQVLEYKLVEKLFKHNKIHLNNLDILDVGCGEGRWLRKFVDWGAEPQRLFGVDLNQEIIGLAGQLSAPGIHFMKAFAEKLPFKDEQFDVILLVGVLQHILEGGLQQAVGKELLRVLRKDGVIITYNYSDSGWSTVPAHEKDRIEAMGVSESVLEGFFSGCQIDYEEMLLSDSLICNVIPDQWGALYDLAIDPYSMNHSFSIATIRKA
ncbi:methyltransferase domain-containing protein [Anaeroarcus burkinensis]|uniref:methyltransferase domain-containing protein n=1 Tax=Anaeroarcus burkinensis TaxID=82376 RepID=UPI0003FEF04B|nr:methyltransferase domain-containing protein [Anaeroarcus burkinensis]